MNLVLEPGNAQLRHVAEPACFGIAIETSDYQITPSSAAHIKLTFKDTYTALPNGTAFKIWGYDFEVGPAITSTTFPTSIIGSVGAASFILMLRSNLNFANKVFTNLVDLGAGVYRADVLWIDCGEQQNFAVPETDLAALSSILDVIDVQNGVTGQNKENFRLVTSLQRIDGNNLSYISDFEAADVELSCFDTTLTYVYPIEQIRALLSTPMPALSPTSDETGESNFLMIGEFRLAYGSTYSDNCVAQAGDMQFSQVFTVINAAIKYPNLYGMREYTLLHPEGLPPGQPLPKALTTQPKKHFICADSFAWLWYHVNASMPSSNFQIVVKKKDGSSDVTYTSTSVGFFLKIYNLNVSPARVASLSGVALSNIKSYTVSFRDASTKTHQDYEYIIQDCGCGYTDMYVLSEAGGFMTIVVKIEEDEVRREYEEIKLNENACFMQPAALGRRTQKALRLSRLQRALQVRPVFESKSDEVLRMLTDAAQSPVAYLKIKDPNGVPALVRFVFENSKISIGPKFSDSDFVFAGYLQEQIVQSQLK